MNSSKMATLSVIVSLLFIVLTLLNLNAINAAAFPRSPVSTGSDQQNIIDLEEYLRDHYYELDDHQLAVPAAEVVFRPPPAGLGVVLQNSIPLDDIDRSRLFMRTRPSGQSATSFSSSLPSSSSSGRGRQMDKRHICEFHGVCEQCAKHTKSHDVYSQCCRNAEGRKWCTDFMNYQMGRK